MFKEINRNSKRTEIMEKEFTPYEIALELKELGFDEPCIAHYTSHGYYNSIKELKWKRPTFSLCGGVTITNGSLTWQEDSNVILKQVIAPTFSQAFRWFREKHDIVGDVTIFDRGFLEKDKWCYQFRIHLPNDPNNYLIDIHEFKTYEEAELACLRELIELVKLKE